MHESGGSGLSRVSRFLTRAKCSRAIRFRSEYHLSNSLWQRNADLVRHPESNSCSYVLCWNVGWDNLLDQMAHSLCRKM
jgi:hypothetical protein